MKHRCLCAVLLTLLIGGCERPEPLPPDVVAWVGGEGMRYSSFQDFLSRQLGPGTAVDSRVLSRLFDRFLREEQLRRLAVDEGRVGPEASPRRALEALLSPEVSDPITPEEVATYFQAHRHELIRPERVRLRHLLVAEAAAARRAREEILAGRSFASVAAEHSLDPFATRGGDQGELAVEDLPEPFARVVEQLPLGQVSEIEEAADGFHLFLVEERRPAEIPTLAAATPAIVEELERRRADALLAELLSRAKARYNVRILRQNLPFQYEGAYDDDAPIALPPGP